MPDDTEVDEAGLDTPEVPDTVPAPEVVPDPFEYDDPGLAEDEDEDPADPEPDADADPDPVAGGEDADGGGVDEDPPAAEDAPVDPPPEPAPQADPDAALMDALDLDPEVYDDGVVKAFKAVKDVVAGLVARERSLQDTITSLTEEKRAKEADAWFDTFDARVNELGIEDFGTGTRSTLPKDAVAARQALLDEMHTLSLGIQAAGKPPLPLPDLVKKAAALLGKSPAVAKPAPSRPALARPGRTAGPDGLSPEQRAVRNLRRKMAQMHADAGEDDF